MENREPDISDYNNGIPSCLELGFYLFCITVFILLFFGGLYLVLRLIGG